MKVKDRFRGTFIDAYKTYPKQDLISRAEYRSILEMFNMTLANETITTGTGFKLPKLGVMGVGKYKTKFKIPNHHLGSEVKAHFKNLHSEGWIGKFFWKKKLIYGAKLRHPVLWRFRPTKRIKAAISSAILNENTITKYYVYE